MPATHRQIVELLDERDRAIQPLPAIATRFGELGIAPVPTFFPFDTRIGKTVYDAIWPMDVLARMRRAILDKIVARGIELRSAGRRIFLSRQSFTQRQLVNEPEIIEVLTRHGFDVVYPEKLSFIEQIELFYSADLVVGSASSALTNCIFCNPSARVIALIHGNPSFNFRGYTSMIESSGANLFFIRGSTIKGEKIHPFHANYTISCEQIIRGLELARRST
jgi:hypothetical protein